MSPLIATHAGLRGLPGTDLTPAVVRDAVWGLAALLADRGLPAEVAVARDERASGAALSAAVRDSALAAGLDVVDLGVTSTPAAKRHLARHALGGAIIVTGSHLAPALNGLKLVAGDPPCPVDPRALPAPRTVGRSRGQLRFDSGAATAHIRELVDTIDTELIRAAGLTARCTGGVGDAGMRLLAALGVRPGDDLHLALDSDADRLAIAGAPPDAVLLLAAAARRPEVLVRGADATRAVEALAGRTVVVAPGELHLVEAMVANGAALAGEGNGGVVRADVAAGRDGLGAAALVLELLARRRRPLAEVLADLPAVHVRRATRTLPGAHERAAALPGGRDLGDARGVEFDHGGAWVLVRASATEPVVRVTTEAGTDAEAASLLGEVLAELER